MRTLAKVLVASTLCASQPHAALAQSTTNLLALRGLAPVSTLQQTPEGRAALDANLDVTGAIQQGRLKQPLLMSFAEQQQAALNDAFITDGNATQLADGLGSKLARIYQEKARYPDPQKFTSVAQSVADFIAYTNNVTKADSNSGKYFFANATLDGKKPVSEAAFDLMKSVNGTTDIFGKAYGRPAGTHGADAYGNSRPFQTEPALIAYRGKDYLGNASHSIDWLRGPSQNLTDSPSYPSGHTTYGYTESLVLALLVPARYQQMIARAAEYGNNRIVIGAHYAMDVLGGRATSMHAVAHLLANDPRYVGRPRENPAIDPGMRQAENKSVDVGDYPALLKTARTDLTAILEAGCGATVVVCATQDDGRFRDATANAAFYEATQTYGLPVVHGATATAPLDVAKIAPEAGHLLTAAFPKVTLAEANAILTETLGQGGGFLDNGSSFGVYSRINLYAAAGKAAAMSAGR